MEGTPGWVLLTYHLPREPSTPRITLWRKLNRLGVAKISDGLVALPLDSRTRLMLRDYSGSTRDRDQLGWYVPADEPYRVASSDRWEILRKYYLALPFRLIRNALRRVRRLYADWWAGR